MYATTISDLYREYCERCGGDQPALSIEGLRDEWDERVGSRYEDATPEKIEQFFDDLFTDLS